VSRLMTSAALLAAATMMLMAACGGDDDGDSTEDFAAEADALCIETAEEVTALFNEEGIPQSFEEDVALLAKRLPIGEELLAEASDLDPPEDIADEYEAYLAELEENVALRNDALDAGEAGDESSYQSYLPRFEAQGDAIDAAAEASGLEACAGILPEDQVADVEAVIQDTATTGDPAHCTEDYTANFVESQGGPEACEQGERDPANQADSVAVTEVKGVDEVTARAEVTITGGPLDGDDAFVELIFEDGRWKVDALFPAVAPDETPGE
jgi:hypothetical protein